MSVTELLAPERLPFDIAIAEAMTDTLLVPYREIMDPQQTPEEFLPFLAAHRSVDLWFDDWAVQRKRDMITEAPVLASIKGTYDASIRFLAYVDGTIIDAITYPSPFILDEAILDETPIDLPAFVAQYLVKVVIIAESDAFALDDGILDESLIINPDTTKLTRCLMALRVAKAPETEMRVDFQHKRPLSLIDAPHIGGSHFVGEYVDRLSLEGTP
jgi:P2-related tail formation protein